MDKKFQKTYSFRFSKVQIKQILTYYLLASGELIPQTVYDNTGYEEFEPDITLQCEDKDDEMIDLFDIIFSFDESDIKSYKETYGKEGHLLFPINEEKEQLPDNVWTQASSLPCGKSECPINDEKE